MGLPVGEGNTYSLFGLSLLFPEDLYRVLPDGQRPIGILCFQRRFHDFTIDPGNLPSDVDDALL